MKIREEIKEEIKRKINILDLVGEYVSLKKKGVRYWGLCPFHNEKTPSFTVTPEKDMFYCFGCHKHGDIFTFLMEIEKLSFYDALKILAKKAHIELSFQSDDGYVKNNDSLIDLYNRLAGTFHHILLNSDMAKEARDYLKKRGVNDETISVFKIGFAPSGLTWILNLLKKNNYSEDFIIKSGLFKEAKGKLFPFFSGRIIFPISNIRGDVIAFGGRILSGKGPKYINSPETSIFKKGDNIYGINISLQECKEKGFFYLVEGYMDVLSLYQAGIKNCIAPLGTALTDAQVKLLGRYAKNVIILFDGDEAGIRATIRAIEIIESQNIESGIIEIPLGLDPDDIIKKHGINGLNKLLKYPINSLRYLLKKAFEIHNKDTPKGKEEIFNFIYPYLKRVDSQIKLDSYFSIIADFLNVKIQAVRNDFEKRAKKRACFQDTIRKDDNKVRLSDELFLLIAVIAQREYFNELRNSISVDQLTDQHAKEIYILLEDSYRAGRYDDLEYIISSIENKSLASFIAQKLSSDEFAINTEMLIFDGIRRLKKKILLSKREEISLRIRKSEKKEPWKMKDLLVEKMILDKEFEELKVKDNV